MFALAGEPAGGLSNKTSDAGRSILKLAKSDESFSTTDSIEKNLVCSWRGALCHNAFDIVSYSRAQVGLTLRTQRKGKDVILHPHRRAHYMGLHTPTAVHNG